MYSPSCLPVIYIPIDSETRRRAATDFVRGLMVLYLEQITQIIKTYVEQYLNVRICDIRQ